VFIESFVIGLAGAPALWLLASSGRVNSPVRSLFHNLRRQSDAVNVELLPLAPEFVSEIVQDLTGAVPSLELEATVEGAAATRR